MLTHPTLAELADGVAGVAASPAVWTPAGPMTTVEAVPWLVPVRTGTRTVVGSGRELASGEFAAPGERIRWRHAVTGLRAEQVVIEATPMRSTPNVGRRVDGARSTARVWGVTAPDHGQPYELMVALAHHAVANDLVAGTEIPEVLLGELPAAGEPVDPLLLAVSAAVGFLAAHGVSGVFGPAGLPQELAKRAETAFAGVPRWVRAVTVLTACHAVQVLITVLLRVVGVPEWRGGLLTMAIPPTGHLVGRWAAARGGL